MKKKYVRIRTICCLLAVLAATAGLGAYGYNTARQYRARLEHTCRQVLDDLRAMTERLKLNERLETVLPKNQ